MKLNAGNAESGPSAPTVGAVGAPPSTAGMISERFTLRELLGSGGTASVFAAHDAARDSEVALKILHPHLSQRAETREAFFRQARAASAIRHPNVAAVIAVGTDRTHKPPVAWIALERAAGVTLHERIERQGPLATDEVLALASGTLHGLSAAHAVAVVHRDLSPGNIMVPLTEPIVAESVRLIDFGLADAAGRPVLGVDLVRSAAAGAASGGPPSTTQADPAPGVLGTVNYLSPEQARGEPVDERADLYQLSAVLFYATTGQPPYLRDSAEDTVKAHLHAPPPVPSALRPGLPREIDQLVVCGMLKSAQSRFSSAEEMLGAVQDAAARLSTARAVSGRAPSTPSALEHDATAQLQDAPGTSASRTSTHRTVAPTRVLPNPAQALTVALPSPGQRARAARARSRGSSSPADRNRARRAPKVGWIAALSAAFLAIAVGGLIAASGSTLAPVIAQSSAEPSAPPIAPSATPSPSPTQSMPATVEVPLLSRLTLAEARALLASSGLAAGTVSLADAALAEGTVLSASRAPGEWAELGWSVDLVVASGWNTVPAVLEQSVPEATATLNAAGFVAGAQPTNGSAGVAPERAIVIAVDPAAGTRVPIGSTVSVTPFVPPTAPSVPGPTPSASATPEPTPISPQNPPPAASAAQKPLFNSFRQRGLSQLASHGSPPTPNLCCRAAFTPRALTFRIAASTSRQAQAKDTW